MKNIILFTMAIFSLISCNSEKGKNDLQKENLHGNIKFIRETIYEARIDSLDRVGNGDIASNTLKIYNKEGNLTEEHSYDYDGSLMEKWVAKYDDKDILTEAYVYSPENRLLQKNVFSYDKKGNLTEMKSYNSSGSIDGKATYKYDEKKNKIEEAWYNSEGHFNFKTLYKYDTKDKLVEEKYYDGERLYATTTCKYDGKGNFIERLGKDEITDYKWTYQYTYDTKGNWIKKVEYLDNNYTYITEREIKYDE